MARAREAKREMIFLRNKLDTQFYAPTNFILWTIYTLCTLCAWSRDIQTFFLRNVYIKNVFAYSPSLPCNNWQTSNDAVGESASYFVKTYRKFNAISFGRRSRKSALSNRKNSSFLYPEATSIDDRRKDFIAHAVMCFVKVAVTKELTGNYYTISIFIIASDHFPFVP